MECQHCDPCFIAVHLGAGYHSNKNLKEYKALCHQTCKQAMRMLHINESCALDVVASVVANLEDSPITNAGIGSNLNLFGHVECDASLMDGESLHYGAVGALSGVQNPIKVCQALIEEQKRGNLSCGRIPPSFLVGNGALQWARDHGIKEISTSSLLTKNTLSAYHKLKRKLSVKDNSAGMPCLGAAKQCVQSACTEDSSATDIEPHQTAMMDTVGAVCVDTHGNVSSAVSSGGIVLKHPGRVGQAASYGCGCWAQHGVGDIPSVACSTSGCGEHLIKTLLAKQCCDSVLQSGGCTHLGVQKAFTQHFLESPFLASVDLKYGGALVLCHRPSEGFELAWAHTTETMCLGYMSTGYSAPKFHISRLPESSTAGKSLHIQGVHARGSPETKGSEKAR